MLPRTNKVRFSVNKECTARNRAVVNGWCGSLNALARGLGPELAGALVHLGCSMETQDVRLGRYPPLLCPIWFLPSSLEGIWESVHDTA